MQRMPKSVHHSNFHDKHKKLSTSWFNPGTSRIKGSASEMTYIVSSGALNSTHSLALKASVTCLCRSNVYVIYGVYCIGSWDQVLLLAVAM